MAYKWGPLRSPRDDTWEPINLDDVLWWIVMNHFKMVLIHENGDLFTNSFRCLKCRVSWTLFSAILGVGFPFHKPYPYNLYDGEDEPSVLGIWNVWWSMVIQLTSWSLAAHLWRIGISPLQKRLVFPTKTPIFQGLWLLNFGWCNKQKKLENFVNLSGSFHWHEA